MTASTVVCSLLPCPVLSLIFLPAFSFAYIERLLKSPPSVRSELVQNALNQLEHTTRLLNGVGYEKLVYEDFCDTLAHILYRIVNAAPDAPQLTQRGLLEAFNDAPGVSNPLPYSIL